MVIKNISSIKIFCLNIGYWVLGIIIGCSLTLPKNDTKSSVLGNYGSNHLQNFLMTFFNNTSIGMIMIVMGLLTLSLVPMIILVINGVFLSSAILSSNLSLIHKLALVIPHAIIEIPATLLSGYIGTLSLYCIIMRVLGKSSFKYSSKKVIFFKISKLILINVIMYFIAALVEIYITPLIGGLFQ